jgi:hypothetical protein
MKTNWLIPALAVGAALRISAAPLPQNPSVSHATPVSHAAETNAISSKLVALQPPAKGEIKIERVGKMSSRPWTEIVGWHPGTSAFPDYKSPDPQLTLASWKF